MICVFARDGDTPAFYKIDKERCIVLSTASGVLTREDLLGHQARLARDKDFHPSFSQLADFLQVAKIELTAEDVRVFAQTSLFSPYSKRAFLVKNDVTFGLVRMFQILRELDDKPGVRAFRNLDDALEWLQTKDAG